MIAMFNFVICIPDPETDVNQPRQSHVSVVVVAVVVLVLKTAAAASSRVSSTIGGFRVSHCSAARVVRACA